MKNLLIAVMTVGMIFTLVLLTSAQESAPSTSSGPKSGTPPSPLTQSNPGREYSGMYSFLQDGEFVQISVEEEGRVTGFVSRYADSQNGKSEFVDQFFKSAKLDGNKLEFTTKIVNAVWFDFKGTVERGDGKNPADEGYYVLKGTLTENSSDQAKKANSNSREVVLKMFPKN